MLELPAERLQENSLPTNRKVLGLCVLFLRAIFHLPAVWQLLYTKQTTTIQGSGQVILRPFLHRFPLPGPPR